MDISAAKIQNEKQCYKKGSAKGNFGQGIRKMKKKQTIKISCKDIILAFHLGFETREEIN
jgi:hypothetical protein